MGKYLFNPDYTTNLEAILIALSGIAQNLVIILSLGFIRSSLEFRMVIWLMQRKFPDNGEE